MVFFTRIGAFIKEHSLVTALFILLGVGLLFEDGKQMPVDTYMAAGVVWLYIIARYFLKKQRDISSVQMWAWGGLLTYVCVRTLFSDDVGYSIYTFVRYVDAFLVYYLFACYSTKNTPRIVASALMTFSVFVLLFTAVIPIVPRFVVGPSQMNLLYRTYGHNHAADLVVFGFSVAALLWAQTNKRRHIAFMVICVGGTAFYFARGVLLLETGLVNGIVLYGLIWKKSIDRTLLAFGSVLLLSTAVLVFIPYAKLRTISNIFPAYGKQSVWQDERWKYWRQSLAAIRDRPWFGSGPGTFINESPLYQKEPGASSWFVHSFPLEVATETGLVGFVCMMVVIIVITSGSVVKQKPHAGALLAALCVVFAQSVFDYNLDYIVVWFLAWAVTGVLFSQAEKPAPKGTFSPAIVTLLVIISIFYIMNIFLLHGKNVIKHSPLYIPLCASNLVCTNVLLSEPSPGGAKIPIATEQAVLFFHRRNPETLALLAAAYQTAGEVEKSYAAYDEAMTLDPQNNITSGAYISVLLDNKRQDMLLGVVEHLVAAISAHPESDMRYLRSHWEEIGGCFNASTLLWPKGQIANTYQAKSIYYAGLCLVKHGQFDDARELLRIASDARTSWSNIYLDYAGLSFWRYHDTVAARQAIEFCKSNTNSRQHCTEYDGRPLPRASVTDAGVTFVQ